MFLDQLQTFWKVGKDGQGEEFDWVEQEESLAEVCQVHQWLYGFYQALWDFTEAFTTMMLKSGHRGGTHVSITAVTASEPRVPEGSKFLDAQKTTMLNSSFFGDGSIQSVFLRHFCSSSFLPSDLKLVATYDSVLAVEAEVPSTNDPTYSNQRRVAKNILTKRLRIETSDSDYRGGRIKDV
ncbi:hypothetical protein BY996DRAFT_6569817 [Phakopsora pachyrhizi]|nr:hypothetical protein BY996DRAFT_6569817 [Phakopsora pachyrhizi]